MKKIEIMDTTLRDGEQMQNISYSPDEKLTISQILLTEVKIDRLEIASARVSLGEKEGVRKIVEWAKNAGYLDRLEILTFVDYDKSIEWASATGVKRINLLTKGSLKHCREQLKKTPDQHKEDIKNTISNAIQRGLEVNVYLEDFTNGIINSPEYVYNIIEFLQTLPVQRIMLPDTLGIFDPFTTYEQLKSLITKYPDIRFEFHPHNDYGMGTANAIAALKAGISGIHTTINGMGERAGNAPLDEICVSALDFLNITLGIDEKKLYKASQYVEMFSGHKMANNKPVYGKNVFTQTAGIHADGDKKGDLYVNRLIPERFGRKREYALGKLSGKANLEMNLIELGIELTEDQKKVLLSKIIDLGDKKATITMADLPYLISDTFEKVKEQPFQIVTCSINSTFQLKPSASVKCSYNGIEAEEYSQGDGGYDAFMNALKKILKQFNIPVPKLIDYNVEIPPGGRTDALVQATISWQIATNDKLQKTVVTKGVNSDQNIAAIEATLKIVNLIISTL